MPAEQESANFTEGVSDFQSALFEQCLLILEQSIQADARLPRSRLVGLLEGHSYRLYACRQQNEVCGAALVYFSADLAFVLLDYLAIDATRRNQGLGSAFFRALADLISREKPGADWLILEAEDDREGSEENRATALRRIEFYRRLGAQLIVNLPYRFPCADGDFLPMRLMARRLRPGATLSVADITAAMEDTFLHIHGRKREDDLLTWFRANRPTYLDLR